MRTSFGKFPVSPKTGSPACVYVFLSSGLSGRAAAWARFHLAVEGVTARWLEATLEVRQHKGVKEGKKTRKETRQKPRWMLCASFILSFFCLFGLFQSHVCFCSSGALSLARRSSLSSGAAAVHCMFAPPPQVTHTHTHNTQTRIITYCTECVGAVAVARLWYPLYLLSHVPRLVMTCGRC